jgi:hypothetical protein
MGFAHYFLVQIIFGMMPKSYGDEIGPGSGLQAAKFAGPSQGSGAV